MAKKRKKQTDTAAVLFGIYGIIFLMYFLVCWPISLLASHLEKKWSN